MAHTIPERTASAYQEARNAHGEALTRLSAQATSVGQRFEKAICARPADKECGISDGQPLDADVVMHLRESTKSINSVIEQLERYCADCRL